MAKLKLNKKNYIIASIFSFTFFVASFLTLDDYGVSWDNAIHFRRGQAYVGYFLEGKSDYKDLPQANLQGTRGDPNLVPEPRRSMYQNDIQNASYFLNLDSGHPPLNGELAALSNYIFYQKLGILADIASHHLFIVAASSFLVFVVTFFMLETFGMVPALFAALALVTYPVFWSESHFNIKDPVLAAFFAACLWGFYKSLNKMSIRWLLFAILFTAFAFATKFNAAFLPLIIFPYLIWLRHIKKLKQLPSKYLTLSAISPLIVLIFLYAIWPYLWQKFPGNFQSIINYYIAIGTGNNYQSDNYYFLGMNLYPLIWFILTTPPLVLVLLILGIVKAIKQRKSKKGVTVLWLIWFFVPFIRVSLPGTSIYGGLRQIFEFIPAMALLAGLGALWIIKKSKHAAWLLIIAFIWPVLVLIQLHPNQNVYFNFLVGGLNGAQKSDIPSWGNSFGNAYKEGIEWLNAHAPNQAKLALLQGTPSNAPPIYLRSDINYLVNGNIDSTQTYFSGIEREGEYVMELTGDIGRDFFYTWAYAQQFLNPVYELKVDNVAILTIWKNDFLHTKEGMQFEEVPYTGKTDILPNSSQLEIRFEESRLSRADVKFNSESCSPSGNVNYEDETGNWIRFRDGFPQLQKYRKSNVTSGTLSYNIAGVETEALLLNFDGLENCDLASASISIYILK